MLLRRLMLNNKEIDNMRILGVKHYYSTSSSINANSFTFSAPASGKTSLVEINYSFYRDYNDYSVIASNKVGYIIGNGSYEGITNDSYQHIFTVTVSGNNISFTILENLINYFPDLQFIVYEVET